MHLVRSINSLRMSKVLFVCSTFVSRSSISSSTELRTSLNLNSNRKPNVFNSFFKCKITSFFMCTIILFTVCCYNLVYVGLLDRSLSYRSWSDRFQLLQALKKRTKSIKFYQQQYTFFCLLL